MHYKVLLYQVHRDDYALLLLHRIAFDYKITDTINDNNTPNCTEVSNETNFGLE